MWILDVLKGEGQRLQCSSLVVLSLLGLAGLCSAEFSPFPKEKWDFVEFLLQIKLILPFLTLNSKEKTHSVVDVLLMNLNFFPFFKNKIQFFPSSIYIPEFCHLLEVPAPPRSLIHLISPHLLWSLIEFSTLMSPVMIHLMTLQGAAQGEERFFSNVQTLILRYFRF